VLGLSVQSRGQWWRFVVVWDVIVVKEGGNASGWKQSRDHFSPLLVKG